MLFEQRAGAKCSALRRSSPRLRMTVQSRDARLQPDGGGGFHSVSVSRIGGRPDGA